jgi:molecular chaperone GrpE
VTEETNGSEPEVQSNGPATQERAPDSAEPAASQVDPLEAAQAELAKTRDQLLRTAADFDNFRKRTRRELVDAEKRGREELLRELLPVFDNLERAAQHAESATEVQSLADGIRMVMRQFYDTLSRAGIERIDAEGQAFDPALMEAIQQIETADRPPGSVAAQVQAGYRMGDRLVRPAMVVVAKAPAVPVETSPADES